MCACVVLHEGATLTFEELNEFLKGKEIAKYKLPERLEIVQDFPHSSFGKVLKSRLVEIILGKAGAEQKVAAAK